jgi:hypothetical protein
MPRRAAFLTSALWCAALAASAQPQAPTTNLGADGALAAWRRMGYVNSSDSDRFRFLGQFGGYALDKRD